MDLRVLFYGSPGEAVPFLEMLAGRTNVVAAVTKPEKPKGRGLAMPGPGPVKIAAGRLHIPVFEPEDPREIEGTLKSLKPDLGVAVAYGRILKPSLIELPALGTLNVHFSLLPRHRGPAPIAWCIRRGETKTGVTVFWIDAGVDTGPVFLSRSLEVAREEDFASLKKRLVALGVSALAEAVAEIRAGRIVKTPQAGEPSLAPKLGPADARVSLENDAVDVHNLVRSLAAGPSPYIEILSGGRAARLILRKTRPVPSGPSGGARPGTVVRIDGPDGFVIECAKGTLLRILEVQLEGKKAVPAASFLNGLRLRAGEALPLKTGPKESPAQ